MGDKVRPGVGIRDVAAAAGVSVTTVSHTLSGARSVKPATRERVLREIERLGYRPDPRARGLRSQRSYLLGLVGDRLITSPHASRMVLGAQETATVNGSVVVALDSGGDPALEEEQIRYLLDHRVDGVIYARMFHQEVTVPASLAGLPVVLLDARTAEGGVDSVAPDEEQIAAVAVRHLVAHGHKRIGYVATEDDAPAVAGRERGFRDELTRAGVALDDALVVRSTADAGGGREAAGRLLDAPARPTAVFCFNDQMAMGVYQAAAARGLAVPRDLSVVGVDNLPFVAEALDPGLTTVEIPHFEMGRWAVARLLERVAAPGAEPIRPAFASELVERGSVASPA